MAGFFSKKQYAAQTSMAGFFSKKQYAAMAESELAIKLLKERCLECSICAIFFNSSLTVSTKARFLSRILSATLIREFFMLFFTLVISCMPSRKRFSNRACPIYPLSAYQERDSRTGLARYTPCPRRVYPLCSAGTFSVSMAHGHLRFPV